MICAYCATFHESPTRVGTERFCLYARKMVSSDDPVCNEMSITTNFRCRIDGCDMSFPMCTARQTKPELWPDCAKCSQKKDILEIKRFVGMRKRLVGQIAEKPFVPALLEENKENDSEIPPVPPIPVRPKLIKRREAS